MTLVLKNDCLPVPWIIDGASFVDVTDWRRIGIFAVGFLIYIPLSVASAGGSLYVLVIRWFIGGGRTGGFILTTVLGLLMNGLNVTEYVLSFVNTP